MSADVKDSDTTAAAVEAHDHPSDWVYIKIALLLGILTAIEISISYWKGIKGPAQNTLLLGLAVTKFAMVALYFMHLKFDAPFLRRVFVAGIVFAIVFYSIYLMTLGVFA